MKTTVRNCQHIKYIAKLRRIIEERVRSLLKDSPVRTNILLGDLVNRVEIYRENDEWFSLFTFPDGSQAHGKHNPDCSDGAWELVFTMQDHLGLEFSEEQVELLCSECVYDGDRVFWQLAAEVAA